MHTRKLTPPIRDSQGFSLVELMVVISIISVLSVMVLPQIAIFKIRAAQAEMLQNTRIIFTHITSYRSENESYPIGGGWGKTIYDVPSINYHVENSYCDNSYPSPGGLRMNNCDKLRYVYSFYPPGSHGLCPAVTDVNCFTIEANGAGYTNNSGVPYTYAPGGGVPTRHCKRPSGYEMYYVDIWYMNANGVVNPSSATSNAAKSCFQ